MERREVVGAMLAIFCGVAMPEPVRSALWVPKLYPGQIVNLLTKPVWVHCTITEAAGRRLATLLEIGTLLDKQAADSLRSVREAVTMEDVSRENVSDQI